MQRSVKPLDVGSIPTLRTMHYSLMLGLCPKPESNSVQGAWRRHRKGGLMSEELKTNSPKIILIIIIVIVAAGLAGGGVYLWQKNVQLQKELGYLQQQSQNKDLEQSEQSASSAVSTNAKTEPANTSSKTDSQSVQSPTQVVETFMRHTFSTISGGEVNYEAAKNYLTEDLKAQFTDNSFVPILYGIQNGPDSARVLSEEISGSDAAVKVQGYLSDSTITWVFELVKENSSWKINDVGRG